MGLVAAATFVGFFVRQEMSTRHANHMAIFLICSFIASLIASAGFRLSHVGTAPETALGTSVLFLIPGVPLINSIFDLLEGHVLVGISRASQRADPDRLHCARAFGHAVNLRTRHTMNWDVIGRLLGDGLLAAVAAIGFAVISNPPRKAIFISALLAAVGHALRFYLIRYTPLDIAMASLVAAAHHRHVQYAVRQTDPLSGRNFLVSIVAADGSGHVRLQNGPGPDAIHRRGRRDTPERTDGRILP